MLASDALPVNRQAWSVKHRRPWKRSDVTDQMVICAFNDASVMADVTPADLLVTIVGAPLKVVEAATRRALDRGYIECGVSVDSGWVTAKGLALFGILAPTANDTVICR